MDCRANESIRFKIASTVIDVATGRPLKSLVSNSKSGTISANGGRVELTAGAARAVVVLNGADMPELLVGMGRYAASPTR